MHRSGTSLTASLLAALSVHLGDQLLPGDSHNQPGYFEDIEFLGFQREVLSQLRVPDERGHSDWGWTESESLDVGRFSEFRDQAQRLLMARTDKTGPWGWKDPRTTLFLDFWDSLLEEARYVLVYRFPWDVADSMQRLEAEVFLRNPEYAYRIWAFYNRRLRDFYQDHSDRCLLVSVNALKENVERFVKLLTDKLGLPTQASRLEEIFKDHLFQTIGGQDPLIDLVAASYPDCARLLSDLDELADISGAGLWQARPVRTRLARPDAAEDENIDVSVVTPCYEQGTLLLESIASVERNAPPHCELIIVNDGSRQPLTLEILNLLKRGGYFVFDQENAGLSAARNKGISLARGRYILPLDDDNRLREGFLPEAIQILNDSPEIGVVYGDRYDFGLRTAIERVGEFDLDALLDGNYIDACAVFRKQVWTDCQGYDPLMCPMDDWEFWVHAAERGWRFRHIPRVTFDYRVRPNSLIADIRSGATVESFRTRIRAKYSQLYWAKAVKELEALKGVVAEQADLQNRLQNELNGLKDELVRLKDELVRLKNEQARLQGERDSLAAQLAEREARLEMITSSRGWRLVSFYARWKHRILSPLYGTSRAAAAPPAEAATAPGVAPTEVTVNEQGNLSVAAISEENAVNVEVDTPYQTPDQSALLSENGFRGDPIFYHRPHGQVVQGITEQVIKNFTRLCEHTLENPGRLVFSKPDNLTLVTYNNYKRSVLIEKCYEAYGINDYVVLGKEIVQWNWSGKIRPVLDYLESGKCLSEYIVATDSDDVLMVSNPANIIDLFESYSCDVLFCNTFVDYPPNKPYREFEMLKYYTHPFHAHLSAGGYIARRGALIEFLRKIALAYEEKSEWAMEGESFNDQLAWRHLHYQYYPRIKVDFKSLIFKRYDLFMTLD